MANWFLVYDRIPRDGAGNMAIDEFLFNQCHQRKSGFLRLYTWNPPTFSYGVSQRIDRILDLAFLEKNGCGHVRRPSGGKTVLHDDELTYAVISSEDIFFRDHDLYRSYLLISRVLVKALAALGLDARLSSGSSAELSRSDNPCFSFPTANEIEVNGKKIVGSAQKRDRTALLQHGSIPIRMDYDLYAGGTRSRADILRRQMAPLTEVAGLEPEQLAGALIAAFEEFVGCRLEEFSFGPGELEAIARLRRKYLSADWNDFPQQGG